jgi:hypothetical protein
MNFMTQIAALLIRVLELIFILGGIGSLVVITVTVIDIVRAIAAQDVRAVQIDAMKRAA